jgi:hypothetical protein
MGTKDYKSGGGLFGFGISGGEGIEFSLFQNAVHGAMIKKSTTGSSQLTGTGNGTFLYNIDQGVVVLNGETLNIDAAVDQACETPANIMANGYARTYMFIVYEAYSGTPTRLTVKGTVALSASVLPPTVAAVEAAIPAGAAWLALGTMTIKRTADTTVTETVDNTYRPLLVPKRPDEV